MYKRTVIALVAAFVFSAAFTAVSVITDNEPVAEAHTTGSCKEYSFVDGKWYMKYVGYKISNGWLWVGHRHSPNTYPYTGSTHTIYQMCQKVYNA